MTLETLKKILDVLDKIYHILISKFPPIETEKKGEEDDDT